MPLVQVIRGGLVEGVHHGSAVVLAADGQVLGQAGDPDAAFYPRSALKPVQAVAMLRAGLPLDGELLALTAASHSGQQRHLAGARRILAQGQLAEDLLRNVPDLPYGAPEREAWLRAGYGPSRLAQNCSGKHAAMLLAAQLRDWPLEGYLDPAHPLQQLIAETVEDLTGQRIAQVTVDGCGAPLFAVSPRGLARALARIATAPRTPRGPGRDRHARAPRDGRRTGRDVARLMRAVPGLVAKDGFEGSRWPRSPTGGRSP
ncbi:asparaginase [Streptomyces sp. FXJ1.4098]|nr:asparaginase [Streptomyces sp. FXJ1.4098]